MLHIDDANQLVKLSTRTLEPPNQPGLMLRDPQAVYEGAERVAAAWREKKTVKELKVRWLLSDCCL